MHINSQSVDTLKTIGGGVNYLHENKRVAADYKMPQKISQPSIHLNLQQKKVSLKSGSGMLRGIPVNNWVKAKEFSESERVKIPVNNTNVSGRRFTDY